MTITLLAVTAAVLYIILGTKFYTSTASLYINPQPQRVVNEDTSLPGSTGADLAIVESQLSIIDSQKVLGAVVDKLGLERDEDFAPLPGQSAQLRNAISDLFGAKRSALPASPRTSALEAVSKSLKAKRAEKTYIVNLEFMAQEPHKAARILQAIIDAYMAEQTAAKQLNAQRVSTLIDARLNELAERVRQADLKVDAFKRANRIVVSEGGVVGEQQLTKLNAELINAQAAAAASKAQLNELVKLIERGASIDGIPEALNSNVILRLREQYAQAARRVASLRALLLPGHPAYIEAVNQERSARGQITDELRRIAASIRSTSRTAIDRQREIERTLETAKREVARSTTALIQLRALEQDAAASRDLLKLFQTRAGETQEQQKTAIADVRVVSPPLVPWRPSRPNSMLVLALGALGGLGLGVARALFVSQRDTTLRTASSVRAASGLEVLATLPLFRPSPFRLGRLKRASSGKFKRVLYALEDSHASHANGLRHAVVVLLSRLGRLAAPRAPTIVLFTSPHSEAGTSTVALTVALASAQLADRTLLIDTAPTRSWLTKNVAASPTSQNEGATADELQLAAQVVKDADTGLDLLTLADLRSRTNAERRHLIKALQELAAGYELVAIDSRCLFDDEAAMILMPAASVVALVVRAGVTTQAQVSEAARLLDAAKSTAVLTMAPPDAIRG